MAAKPKIDPALADAAQEVLRRRQARKTMGGFARYIFPDKQWEWFHDRIFEGIDMLVDGEIKNLAVFMPPQHGKSTVVSHLAPAYIFGRTPTAKMVAASYGAQLAQRNSREVQRIIDDERYQRIFPETTLNTQNIKTLSGSWLRNVEIFEIVGHGGAYKCSGVGGSLTGFTGDYGLIDDPYKDYAEGSSPTVRDSFWDWYVSVFSARLNKHSRQILIQTRWHPDDAWARIQETTGDYWHVISLPALCIDPNAPGEMRERAGEALWPALHDEASLEAKRKLNPHQFEALYQQEPRPREGGLFDRASIEGEGRENIVYAAPENVARRVRRWDLAASTDGDWTVGLLMSRADNTYFVEDVIRVRMHATERNALILETARRDREKYGHVQTIIPEDPGAAGKEVAEYLVRMLAGFPVKTDRETKRKEVRAEPFADQVRGGNVRLIRGPWNEEFIAELSMFPGTHDDQVDAASGAFLRLAKFGRAGNVFSLLSEAA